MEEIRLLVDNLKPRYKNMIEMFYFKELSHEEISERLKMPLGTIKAQLFRARDLLYSALKRREGKV
jgi:RNA polymerase sigma-70 factor (ECF subfamily)